MSRPFSQARLRAKLLTGLPEVSDPQPEDAASSLPTSEHERLASQLEQHVRMIAAGFRLKEPRSSFSPSEWLVLSSLVEEGCALKELSRRTGLTIPSTAQITRRLSLLRLVNWKRTPTDPRNYVLAIMPQGRRVHMQTRENAVRDNAACFGVLTVEELRTLTQLLGKCVPEGKP